MSIRLEVNSNKAKYELTIERKYNMVLGNSATGKTLMTDFIAACYNGGEKAVSIVCPLSVETRLETFRSIKEVEFYLDECNGIVILDENLFTNIDITPVDLAKILKAYDVYYILISREAQLYNNILVSVHDMFYLKKSGKYHTFKHIYSGNSEVDSLDIEYIITEDSKSSKDFMEYYFEGIDVLSAYGRSNIAETVHKYRGHNVLVMYDALSFGLLEEELQKMVQAYIGVLYLFRPLSFEKYLLDSPFLKNFKYDDNGPIESLEDFYAETLSKALPHGYAKGKIPFCVKEDCATGKKIGYQYCEDCKLQNMTRSKRELVVYGVLAKIRRK